MKQHPFEDPEGLDPFEDSIKHLPESEKEYYRERHEEISSKVRLLVIGAIVLPSTIYFLWKAVNAYIEEILSVLPHSLP